MYNIIGLKDILFTETQSVVQTQETNSVGYSGLLAFWCTWALIE